MKKKNRDFTKPTGLAGSSAGNARGKSTAGDKMSVNSLENEIRFLSPIDGDMLNEYDGIISDGCLLTKMKVLASTGRDLKINGIEAKFEDSMYLADVRLKDYKNVIEVVDVNSGEKQSIIVFWLKNIVNKYRLSLDDNIWFLRDIYNNVGKYKSIFETPHLGFLKHVHDTYGTKIHLNIFFQTDGFNLSQMPDKYKNEWKENAGWLRLNFHALQEDPDMPYINAGYNKVKRDCEKVLDQIRRFAGAGLIGPVMTLHWGEATAEGCRALRDTGYTALAGYFNVDGTEPVSYYLDLEKRKHINNRFMWRDNQTKIIFERMAIVIDTKKLEQIIPHLDSLRSDSHKPAYIDLMVHEQYFYPFYKNYQPDCIQKVLTAVKWATDNGYKPAFLSECIFS